MIEATTNPIAALNDAFTTTLQGGTVVFTAGIQAYSPEEREIILAAVRDFSVFNSDNDPYGEHDFGAFYFNNQQLFWKVNYYDLKLEYGSENPADPSVTTRVLTVMLASEY
jgi:hypothetical protein